MTGKIVAGGGFDDFELCSTNDYLTPKEHELIGSSLPGRYKENPDTPIDVIRGEASVEECNKKRRNIGRLENLGKSIELIPLNLNPMSRNYGTTIQDG